MGLLTWKSGSNVAEAAASWPPRLRGQPALRGASDLVDRVLDLFLGVADGRLHLAGRLVGGALVLEIGIADHPAGLFLHGALHLVGAALHLIVVHGKSSRSRVADQIGAPAGKR